MITGKGEYLRRLTSRMPIRSMELGKELDGSTPPSVFIGSWNYPKVYAGPMISPYHGDTSFMDLPESWIPQRASTRDIVKFRLDLVRGKQEVSITDLDNKLVEKLREISLASGSIESEVEFTHTPRGSSFTDEHTPHGPSAVIKEFDIYECRWDHDLEKTYYDTDFKAKDAVLDLYEKGLPFSRIQKAFSVGAMGTERRRRLVPTRWSITACDTILADRLLGDVRRNPVLETYRVHEFSSLSNYYAVILLPTAWQYEWMEAFLRVLGNEEVIFSDFERNHGKKEYSIVGGCYYSCKMGVLERLAREGVQAGAIVLREAYQGYVPLGVFNVRENVRHAMAQQPSEFHDIKTVLAHLSTKLRLPIERFINQSMLLKDHLRGRQTTLKQF